MIAILELCPPTEATPAAIPRRFLCLSSSGFVFFAEHGESPVDLSVHLDDERRACLARSVRGLVVGQVPDDDDLIRVCEMALVMSPLTVGTVVAHSPAAAPDAGAVRSYLKNWLSRETRR